MKLDPHEQLLGTRWFFGAGLFALALLYFMVHIDTYLTTSDREIKTRDMLRELRLAQTSLPSGVTDTRQVLGSESEKH